MFRPAIDKGTHNLRRWKNDGWRRRSAKGCSNTTVMKAFERLAGYRFWSIPVPVRT